VNLKLSYRVPSLIEARFEFTTSIKISGLLGFLIRCTETSLLILTSLSLFYHRDESARRLRVVESPNHLLPFARFYPTAKYPIARHPRTMNAAVRLSSLIP
jgi:hypothetical protein